MMYVLPAEMVLPVTTCGLLHRAIFRLQQGEFGRIGQWISAVFLPGPQDREQLVLDVLVGGIIGQIIKFVRVG